MWPKGNKIKKICQIKKVEDGGLNLIDISSKIQSLKASWIPKWLDKHRWTDLANYILTKTSLSLSIILKMKYETSYNNPLFNKLPIFYQDVFKSYIAAKKEKPLGKMTNYEFFTQVVWGNNFFKFENKPLFYKHWIKSEFIYVLDFFDENGHWHTPEYFFERLKLKTNWISEFAILKKVLLPIAKSFKSTEVKYINTNFCTKYFYYDGYKYRNLSDMKAKDFYICIIDKISEDHYSKINWERNLNIAPGFRGWKDIYKRKVKNIPYKKFCEFNFKILNNILYTGNLINKWDKSVSSSCLHCHDTETPGHLLFNCNRVQDIWKVISHVCNCQITWKNLVIGYAENCSTNIAKNILTTVVSYSIYKTWVMCNNDDNLCYGTINLQIYVYRHIKGYLDTLLRIEKNKNVSNVLRIFMQRLLT